jgi:hypothetical protein
MLTYPAFVEEWNDETTIMAKSPLQGTASNS